MLDETLGKIHFWLLFIGFHTTFLIQHWLGVEGMPRRYADYLPSDGFTLGNQISSAGAFLLGGSTLVFFYNVWKSRNNPKVTDRRSVGLGPIAGVGDHLPAAAPQLHPAAPDPLRVAGLRSASPRGCAQGVRRRPRNRKSSTREQSMPPTTPVANPELRHRVAGDTSDLAAQYEHGHHGQSPEPEEDQK